MLLRSILQSKTNFCGHVYTLTCNFPPLQMTKTLRPLQKVAKTGKTELGLLQGSLQTG